MKLPDATSFGARPSLKTGGFKATQSGSELAPAQATQELGSAIVAAGSQHGEIVRKQEDHENTVRAEDAYNQLREAQLNLTKGEESGFVHRRGADAATKPLYKDYNDKFQFAVNNINDTLDNDKQRELFRRRADVSSLQFKQDLLNHVTQQKNEYAKEVYSGALDLEHKDAASRWSDPNSINMSISRINGVISEEASREGWAPEKEKAIKAKEAAKLHAGVINQALASENTDYAAAWYKKNKKVFDANERAQIEKVIGMGERKELAQTVTDDFIDKGLSEAEAIKKVRKKYKGKEETEIIALLKVRFNEQEQAREANQRTAGDEAWNIYEDTRDFSAIDVTVRNEMDGKELLALEKFAEDKAAGRTTQTDMAVYEEILLEATMDPNKFVKRNIHASADKLSESDRRFFVKAKADILKGIVAPELETAATRDQIVKQAISGMGLDPKDALKSGTSGDRVREAYGRLNQEIAATQTATGKKLDNAEIQKISDKLTMKILRERRFWFNKEIPAGTMEIEGIPNNVIDEYAQAVQRAGQPVTEKNIKELYMYMQQPKKVAPKPAPTEPQQFIDVVPQAE